MKNKQTRTERLRVKCEKTRKELEEMGVIPPLKSREKASKASLA
tara:strand:- start:2321 stop:2452 length:132 start_codon:yes stop_codon:yes gene_type:complete